MDYLNSLLKLVKNPASDTSEVPEGFCPNCWGRQEYGGRFYEAVKNHGLDANTKEPEVGWIKDYAEKNLQGIVLKKEEEGFSCNRCKIKYQEL